MFTSTFNSGVTAAVFVAEMKRKGELIMGIGHRIKSTFNSDTRVSIVDTQFTSSQRQIFYNSLLRWNKPRQKKPSNLILYVDACIEVSFVDLLRTCGAVTMDEATEQIQNGCLNALFVLGRSMGSIGHFWTRSV